MSKHIYGRLFGWYACLLSFDSQIIKVFVADSGQHLTAFEGERAE